ncbi:hypothetical protein BASA82_000130 [Batrachochytrium salamandrivorans]|nr:hypothetical protein BASA81_001284 [Batrachochytrium salamandrivorans]KAH9262860.1 hypothetical protein BASA82_000130 [Batrachochytrium salamandrivorans]
MNPQLYKKEDNYATPRSAWEAVMHLLPKDKVFYDPFWLDGSSGNHLKELGLNVVHTDTDFFTNQVDYDVVITNPPFSQKKAVLEKLLKDGKPFVMIMPVSVVCTKMYSQFIDEGTIVVPRSRIQFIRGGTTTQGKCPFDSFYYFWKMDLGEKLIGL